MTMADRRGFFKLTHDYPDHPKVVEAGGDAGWLNVCAIAYCSRTLTDGMIPINLVPRLSDRENPKQLASALLDVGLWHSSGHDCERCPQPDERHYVIHDYLDHQTSAARAREISEKRAIAGQRGGRAKAAGKLPSNLPGAGYADASSKPEAEVEVEVEVEVDEKKTSSSSNASRKRADPAKGTRIPDDFTVTDAMREWGRANRPGVDGDRETAAFIDYWRSVPGAKGVKADWVATWRNWIRRAPDRGSMQPPYTQTRIESGTGHLGSAAPARPSTTDQRVAQGMAMTEFYAAQGE